MGNLFWNGRDMEIEHGRIKQVHREAIRGVHFQINCASGAKLSAVGREGKVIRAVSKESPPV